MTKLVISSNDLKTLSGVSTLSNLKYLDVSSNKLNTLDGVGGLSKLETLIAAFNRIHSIDALQQLWSHSGSLRRLDLRKNDIGDLSEVLWLGGLINLTELQFADNNLERANPLCLLKDYRLAVFQCAPSLEKLDSVVIAPAEKDWARSRPPIIRHGNYNNNNNINNRQVTHFNANNITDNSNYVGVHFKEEFDAEPVINQTRAAPRVSSHRPVSHGSSRSVSPTSHVVPSRATSNANQAANSKSPVSTRGRPSPVYPSTANPYLSANPTSRLLAPSPSPLAANPRPHSGRNYGTSRADREVSANEAIRRQIDFPLMEIQRLQAEIENMNLENTRMQTYVDTASTRERELTSQAQVWQARAEEAHAALTEREVAFSAELSSKEKVLSERTEALELNIESIKDASKREASMRMEIESLHRMLELKDKTISDLSDKHDRLETAWSKETKEKREELNKAFSDLMQVQAERDKYKSCSEGFSSDANRLSQRSKDLEGELAQTRIQVIKLEGDRRGLEETCVTLETQLANVRETSQRMTAEVRKDRDLRVAEVKELEDSLRNQITELQFQRIEQDKQLNNQIFELTHQLATIQEQSKSDLRTARNSLIAEGEAKLQIALRERDEAHKIEISKLENEFKLVFSKLQELSRENQSKLEASKLTETRLKEEQSRLQASIKEKEKLWESDRSRMLDTTSEEVQRINSKSKHQKAELDRVKEAFLELEREKSSFLLRLEEERKKRDLLLQEIKQLKDEITRSELSKGISRDEAVSIIAARDSFEKKLYDASNKLQYAKDAETAAHTKLVAVESELSTLVREMSLKEETIREMQFQLDELRGSLRQEKKKLTNAEIEVQNAQDHISKAEKKVESVKRECDRLIETLKTHHQDEIRDLESRALEAEHQSASLEEEMMSMRDKFNQRLTTLEEAERSLEVLRSDFDAQQKTTLEKVRTDHHSAMSLLQKEFSGREREMTGIISHLEKRTVEYEAQMKRISRALDDEVRKVEETKELLAERENDLRTVLGMIESAKQAEASKVQKITEFAAHLMGSGSQSNLPSSRLSPHLDRNTNLSNIDTNNFGALSSNKYINTVSGHAGKYRMPQQTSGNNNNIMHEFNKYSVFDERSGYGTRHNAAGNYSFTSSTNQAQDRRPQPLIK